MYEDGAHLRAFFRQIVVYYRRWARYRATSGFNPARQAFFAQFINHGSVPDTIERSRALP
jgi:hypothetical protein